MKGFKEGDKGKMDENEQRMEVIGDKMNGEPKNNI